MLQKQKWRNFFFLSATLIWKKKKIVLEAGKITLEVYEMNQENLFSELSPFFSFHSLRFPPSRYLWMFLCDKLKTWG